VSTLPHHSSRRPYREAVARELAIEWRQADCRRTGLASGTFDQVTSTMLLHELPPFAIAEAIGEAARLLQPGGSMHMLDFQPTGDMLRDRVMRDHSERNNEPFMAMLFDTDVVALCRAAGFVDVSWRAFDERGDGVLASAEWPQRSEWHFPWAVLSARKAEV
jgi:SAM-dependent methyltransferase